MTGTGNKVDADVYEEFSESDIEDDVLFPGYSEGQNTEDKTLQSDDEYYGYENNEYIPERDGKDGARNNDTTLSSGGALPLYFPFHGPRPMYGNSMWRSDGISVIRPTPFMLTPISNPVMASSLQFLDRRRRRFAEPTERFPPKKVHRRVFTNSRERWRQQNVNGAFAELRKIVPTHPPDKKLSKNEILRQAIKYIKLLSSVVSFQKREIGDEDPSELSTGNKGSPSAGSKLHDPPSPAMNTPLSSIESNYYCDSSADESSAC